MADEEQQQEQLETGEFQDESSPPVEDDASQEFDADQSQQEDESAQDQGEESGQQQPNLTAAEIAKMQSDYNRLKRQIAEQEKKEKRRKAEQKREEEKRQQEQGEWQSLAQQREQERDEALQRLQNYERTRRVSSVASRIGFQDPDDAPRFLDDSEVDFDDDHSLEQALSALADRKPYLLEQRPQPAPRKNQGAGPGQSQSATNTRLTWQKLKELTPEEQQRAWESGELQEVLKRGPR